MKRKIYAFIAIIIYLVLVIIGISIFMPFFGNININSLTRDEQGNIYCVNNSGLFVYVYEMDSEGKSVDIFMCRSESGEVDSFCEYSDGALYVGQIWYEDGYQNFSIWKKPDGERQFSRIWGMTLEGDIEIVDFCVLDKILYIAGIEQESKTIFIYSNDNGTVGVTSIKNSDIPTCVAFGNGGVYILSQDNRIYFSDKDGSKTKLNIDNAVILMTDDDGFYYRQKDSDVLRYVFYNGLGEYSYSGLGDIWDIEHSDRAENNAAMTFMGDGDYIAIISQNGEESTVITSFSITLSKMLKKCIVPILIITFVYIAVFIIIYLFKKLIWEKKKLRYQIMAVTAVISALWLTIMLLMFGTYEKNNEIQDRTVYSRICMTIQAGRLEDEADITGLDYDNYIGSIQQEKIEQIFEDSIIGTTWQEFFTREEIVYGYEHPVFVFADIASYGRYADTYYNAKTIEKIKECIDDGESRYFTDEVSGRTYAIAITPVGDKEQQLCLVTRVPIFIGGSTHENMEYCYAISIVGWAVMVVLLIFFMRSKWNFADTIVTQMDKASRGDYRIENKNVPDNEFGIMWTALERMCKNIQIQKYKQNNILDYVNQFAPRNFERLFGKEKLQDIEIGETLQISATMGMISIIDRDTLLTGNLQRQYVQYVNQLMEILFSQQQSENAIFLQDGSNLETVKVIFKEDAESTITAVRYSIDCIETLLGITQAKYNTKPFILLHTSKYSCGIAGGSRQVYPYVTSLEMETLSSFIEPLKNCGVRMVVTSNTWLEAKDKVKGRYIGYVSSKNGKEKYELYEILDAYSQTQKHVRLKNMDNFDRALRLYYANDLYLARSLFSDIVRECPDDGIARWYAFACDELFNMENNADIHYELFGGSV